MRRGLFASLILVAAAASAQAVELAVKTSKGYVAFAVPDEWRVLSAQTKPPISAMTFEVQNAADEGTQHSTNVVVSLFHLDFERGRHAASAPIRSYAAKGPAVETVNGWTVYTQAAMQGDVQYVVVDARRPVADVMAAARIAWPRLKANSPDYDKRMRAAFDGLLNSVTGDFGAVPEKEGQVIRRPVQ